MTEYTIITVDEDKKKESFIQIMKHNLKGDKLCFKWTYYEKNGTNGFKEETFWTDAPNVWIANRGFKRCGGFVDRLAYSFTKTYAKLEGFNQAEPTDNETAESLRNMLESNAVMEFKKGFAKTTLGTLEKKQLLFMIPIILGVVLGAFLLFGGGF